MLVYETVEMGCIGKISACGDCALIIGYTVLMLKTLEFWASILLIWWWWSLNDDDELSLSSNLILFGCGSLISRPSFIDEIDDGDDDCFKTGGWSGGIGNWNTGFML